MAECQKKPLRPNKSDEDNTADSSQNDKSGEQNSTHNVDSSEISGKPDPEENRVCDGAANNKIASGKDLQESGSTWTAKQVNDNQTVGESKQRKYVFPDYTHDASSKGHSYSDALKRSIHQKQRGNMVRKLTEVIRIITACLLCIHIK